MVGATCIPSEMLVDGRLVSVVNISPVVSVPQCHQQITGHQRVENVSVSETEEFGASHLRADVEKLMLLALARM